MLPRIGCLLMLLSVAIVAAVAPSTAQVPRRHALVIGNTEYDGLGPEKRLPRSVPDAEAIGKALSEVGYVVTHGKNLTRSAFNALKQDFLDKIARGDSVTVFFSGHGIQIDGQNYLLPRDMPRLQLTRPRQITSEALSVADLIADIKSKGPRVLLMILDACRDNPLEAAGTMSAGGPSGGLSTRPVAGTFTLYAAGDGEKALERLPAPPGHPTPDAYDRDPHSLYTRKLLPLIRTNLDLTDIAKRVRQEVSSEAFNHGHTQTPAYNDNLTDGQFCFVTPCSAGAAPQVASLAEGRDELLQNNLARARWHFEQLAAAGNTEAMRELSRMGDAAQDSGAMLDWLEKAANAGDKASKLDLAWLALQPQQLPELPKSWEQKLANNVLAKRLAAELLATNVDEAAIIMQAIADEERNSQVPRVLIPELRKAVDKGYGPAIAAESRLVTQDLPINVDDLKPVHGPVAARGLALLESAARRGDPVALVNIVAPNESNALESAIKKFSLPRSLTGTETTQLIRGALLSGAPRRDRVAEARASAEVALSSSEYADLAEAMVVRLATGTDAPKDHVRALELADNLVEAREYQYKSTGRGGRGRALAKLRRARELKYQSLAALGRHVEALRAAETNGHGDDGLAREMFAIAETANWASGVEAAFAEAFSRACDKIEFEATFDPDNKECEGVARRLIADKRRLTFPHILNLVRSFLLPASEGRREDAAAKGHALAMLASLGEVEPSLLRRDESVQALYTDAAALEADEAAAWLRKKGLALPPSRVQHEVKRISVRSDGDWKSYMSVKGANPVTCHAVTDSEGVITRAGRVDRTPFLSIIAAVPGGGFGQPVYMTDVDGVDPASARVYVNRDEVPLQVTVQGKQLVVQADTAAFIRRLSQGTMVRFEFRAGTREYLDVKSLHGFTAVYNALIEKCPGMTSALTAAATRAVVQPAQPTQVAQKQAQPPAKGTNAAQAQQAAKSAPAAAPRMQRQANRYFNGDGYRRLPNSTYLQCAAECEADARCVALEFQTTSATCRHYSAIEPSFATTGTDVALKR